MRQIGRYQVTRALGQGGMGSVYLAREPKSGRQVALKLLSAAVPSARQRERLQREAQALAKLRHPHVVAIHALEVHEGREFLVLDFVPGESLAERIEREGPLPPPEAARIAREVASALTHAHAAEVLHRDVKPANVLLRQSDGAALLTDFGLARVTAAGEDTARLTQSQELLGTPGYLSPEQARGERGAIGPASDVYGLGATLYTMLTGETLFGHPELYQVVIATLETRPTPSGVDAALDAICLRCLEKEPSERYPSAAELCDALDAYLRGERGTGRARPLLLGLLGLSATLSLGGALLFAGREDQGLGGDPSSSPLPGATPTPGSSPGPGREARRAASRKLKEAQAAHRAGDLVAAIAGYDEVLRAFPNLARVYHSRANARLDLGDAAGAESDLDRAIELDPTHALAWGERGLLLQDLGRVREAERDYDEAVRRAPDDAGLVRTRAFFLFKRQRFAEALEAAAELERLEPLRVSGPHLAATSRWSLQLLAGAPPDPEVERLLRVALAREPGHAQVRADLMRWLLEQEAWEEVERLGTDPLSDPARAPALLRWRGTARLRLGRVAEGTADLERFLRLAPSSPLAPLVREELARIRARIR